MHRMQHELPPKHQPFPPRRLLVQQGRASLLHGLRWQPYELDEKVVACGYETCLLLHQNKSVISCKYSADYPKRYCLEVEVQIA